MHDFKRLKVWQVSIDLAGDVHRATFRFPRSDRGALASQLRKAMDSIPANIAEGCGIGSRKETIRFLKCASRSASEVENHLIMADRLRYLHPKQSVQYLDTIGSIQRMLVALIDGLPDDPE
jgi:four helix bundle protein